MLFWELPDPRIRPAESSAKTCDYLTTSPVPCNRRCPHLTSALFQPEAQCCRSRICVVEPHRAS